MADVLPFPTNGIEPVVSGQTPTDSSRRGSCQTPIDTPAPRLRDVVGDVLREERLEQERTLADVAEEAHVSLPYLSEVERGRKEVSSDLLDAICDALDLPLVDLLERAAERLRLEAGSQRGARFELLAA